MTLGAGHRGLTGMTGLDPTLGRRENYRRFAVHEAAGRSPAYERLAYAVAEDGLVLSFLEGLPPAKRQPNLLFGRRVTSWVPLRTLLRCARWSRSAAGSLP